jgi:NAD(P)-dependent dehydrogenase (short-subunit alcohol dehydrogenase family)
MNTPARVALVTRFYGEPDDAGGAIAALLGDGTHWVTGQRTEVSGGQNL